MKNDRQEGGLWCHEVLADLADYVDGELDDARRAQVEAHVAACDNCARFGGAYGEMVASVSRAAPDVPDQVADRLRRALDEQLG